jgi:hypothetical protein
MPRIARLVLKVADAEIGEVFREGPGHAGPHLLSAGVDPAAGNPGHRAPVACLVRACTLFGANETKSHFGQCSAAILFDSRPRYHLRWKRYHPTDWKTYHPTDWKIYQPARPHRAPDAASRALCLRVPDGPERHPGLPARQPGNYRELCSCRGQPAAKECSNRGCHPDQTRALGQHCGCDPSISEHATRWRCAVSDWCSVPIQLLRVVVHAACVEDGWGDPCPELVLKLSQLGGRFSRPFVFVGPLQAARRCWASVAISVHPPKYAGAHLSRQRLNGVAALQ